MKSGKANTVGTVILVILIMLVLFGGCLFFLYKEGYLSSNKEISNDSDVTQNDKEENRDQEKSDSTKKQINMETIYADLKSGKRTITTQNGVCSLNDYLSGEAFNLGNMYTPEKYAYVDLDKDGVKELVIQLSKTNDYAILHYQDDTVYGYSYVPSRGFRDLKEDGTYSSSDSAYTTYISKMSFNKETYSSNIIMNYDKSTDTCTINDESKDSSDCDNYILEQNKKESVKFLDFDL